MILTAFSAFYEIEFILGLGAAVGAIILFQYILRNHI